MQWKPILAETIASLTYSSSDAPVYVASTSIDISGNVSPGMRIRLSQSTGGTKYFIVVAVSSSTLTLYGGTDYTLNNESINEPVFSSEKSPYGFPLDPNKWSISVTNTSQQQQTSPSSGTWYNLGSISIEVPIGIWTLSYQVAGGSLTAGNAQLAEIFITLSTGNSTESDPDLTSYNVMNVPSFSGPYLITTNYIEKNVAVTSKTTYFLNSKTTIAPGGTFYIQNWNDKKKLIIRAVCALL